MKRGKPMYPGSASIRDEIEQEFSTAHRWGEHPPIDYLHLLHRHWQAGNLKPVDDSQEQSHAPN